MVVQGIVVQPEEGPVSSFTPGRSIVLKLLGGATRSVDSNNAAVLLQMFWPAR